MKKKATLFLKSLFLVFLCGVSEVSARLPQANAHDAWVSSGGNSRIFLDSDGNQHDTDDWAATAATLAIIANRGHKDNVVAYTYSNHIWDQWDNGDRNMDESALGTGEAFGYDLTNFIDAYSRREAAYNAVRDAVNASSESNPLFMILAGPMEVAWQGINRSEVSKRKYVYCISHSWWNDNHAKNDHGGHSFDDVKDLDIQWDSIEDQNQGFNTHDAGGGRGAWNFFNNFGDLGDGYDAAYKFTKKRIDAAYTPGDASDCGMVYYLYTGDENGRVDDLERLMRSPKSGTQVSVSGVSVSPATATMEASSSVKLTASVLPSNASNKKVTWTTNNSSVATVNSSGNVKGVSPGTAVITATTTDGGFSATSTVTITPSTGTMAELSAVQDAYLEGNTKYNTEDLRVEGGRRVSYLKFDLSGLTGTISSADLKLSVSNDAGNGVINVAKGSSNNWNENNLSSSNAPSVDGELGTLDNTYSIGQSYTWSLDQSAIQTGGMLTLIVTQVSGGDVSFASDENSNGSLKPVLTIKTSTVTTPEPPQSSDQSPYLGTAAMIPGTIEAENFDIGGEGFAYHDADASNNGGEYRTDEGVDLEARDGGICVAWTAADEWVEYMVNATAGTYDLEARLASIMSGKTISVMLGDNEIATVNVPNTGDWGAFQTVTVKDVVIPGGSNQILRVEFKDGDTNLNWIKFTEGDDSGPIDPPTGGVTGAFIESNGYLVIDAESADISGTKWSKHTTGGNNPWGNGFIQYDGGGRFQADKIRDNGTLKYDIKINTPGTYQFIWRTGYGFNSQSFDGANDTWLKINGSEFYGKSGSRKVDSKGEFMKVWVQKDAFVNECFGEHHGTNGMSIWAEFDAAGDYSIEISGRSTGHVVDRLFLFQSGKGNMAMNANTPESPRSTSSKLVNTGSELSSPIVNVYPNSFENDLNISLSEEHAFDQVQLIDINGTVIEAQEISNESEVHIHTDVNSGVYFLRLKGANENKVVRVIKR